MSEKIRKIKVSSTAQRKILGKHGKPKKRLQKIGQRGSSLARLEDSKNLNTLGEIVAIGTSFAHKRALEISDEVIYASEGQIIRKIKGRKPQIIESISPRKATKGEVLFIGRSRV